jgi:hypothetical protein
MERTRMKRQFSTRWGLLVGAAACAGVAAMPGCELIVDFDRTKIPLSDGGAPEDGTLPDGSTGADGGDATTDGTIPPSEAGPEASPDVTGLDARADVGLDGTLPDAGETGTPDTGVDTGLDSPIDVEVPDVLPEAAPDDGGVDAGDGT